MRTIAVIRRATPEPPDDLWTQLRARLRDEADAVRLRVPSFGWREATALAAAVAVLAAAPDALAVLAASGVL